VLAHFALRGSPLRLFAAAAVRFPLAGVAGHVAPESVNLARDLAFPVEGVEPVPRERHDVSGTLNHARGLQAGDRAAPEIAGACLAQGVGELGDRGAATCPLQGVEDRTAAFTQAPDVRRRPPQTGGAQGCTTRACYEPGLRMPAACWRKRQANAKKCDTATVSGSLS
jgi:hypothetical protein